MISLGSGKGKTRVVSSIAVIFAKVLKNVDRIYIAFSSDKLLESDQEVYKKLKSALPIEVILVVGTENLADKIGMKDLLILDEADWHLYDDIC